jgi:hypothetical protein
MMSRHSANEQASKKSAKVWTRGDSELSRFYRLKSIPWWKRRYADASTPSPVPASSDPKPSPDEPSPDNDSIFIVHGQDGPAKVEVARLIERAGLNAVILHEQPNQGRTVAEKLEDHGGAAGFAVVILTPDDVGGPDKDHLQPRARQNVVGELFWFAGKLGRSRVCALMKGKVEIPSDFAGVVYTGMDDRGAWKGELLKELEAGRLPCELVKGDGLIRLLATAAISLAVMSLRERTRPGAGDCRAVSALSAKVPPSGPGWIHEIKHDGFRILARRDSARL